MSCRYTACQRLLWEQSVERAVVSNQDSQSPWLCLLQACCLCPQAAQAQPMTPQHGQRWRRQCGALPLTAFTRYLDHRTFPIALHQLRSSAAAMPGAQGSSRNVAALAAAASAAAIALALSAEHLLAWWRQGAWDGLASVVSFSSKLIAGAFGHEVRLIA